MDKEFVFADSSSQNSEAHQGSDINIRSTSDNNHLLHPQDNHYSPGPGSPSSPIFNKKGSSASQSSLEFGKGESRSPLPQKKSMLKHATTGSTKQGTTTTAGQSSPRSEQSVPTSSETETSDTNIKLPQRFVCKYLGYRETSNLWGIRYTRRPVDEMVTEAKKVLTTNPEKALALLKLEVTEDGILVGPMPQNSNPSFPKGRFTIESISYGVQDLVYTRVFAMIVVKTDAGQSGIKLSQLVNQSSSGGSSGGALPFRCHAFVCDSRQTARRLTYSLASAFEVFSKKVASGKISAPSPKKFAIDLRPAEELEADMADSEA